MTGKANKKILLAILVFACALRLSLLYINMHRHPAFFNTNISSIQEQISSATTPYLNPFGYEISNIAYSLVCKHEGFSNPFGSSTGPTAWVAPGMVLLYATAFKLFGCFSKESMLFMFLLATGFSLLIIVLVYKTTLMVFTNRTVAYCTAVLFALCPQDLWVMLYPHQTDFNVYAFFFVLVFFLFLRLVKSPSEINLLLFSISSGIAILFNPVMALPVGMCLLFYAQQCFNASPRSARHVITGVMIIALIITPYVAYQKYRLGVWTFIKSNGPFELYLGNTKKYNGVLVYDLFQDYHPGSNKQEFNAYKDLGETKYIHTRFNNFLENFEPSRFIKVTIRRFLCFFFILEPYISAERFQTLRLLAEYIGYALPGLSLLIYPLLQHKNMNRTVFSIYGYILSYAFPYMFTGIMYRYSFPICTLAVVLLGQSLSIIVAKKKIHASSQLSQAS